MFSLALFAISTMAALVAGAVVGTTTAPPLDGTYEYTSIQIIPPELVTIACTVAQDSPGRRFVQACNTTTGSFTSLLNIAEGYHALYWTRKGTMRCAMSDMPRPIVPKPLPAPNYTAMSFSHTTTLGNGDHAHVFKYPLGRYYQSVFFGVDSGLPEMIFSGNMNDVHADIKSYINGSASDDLFLLPSACDPSVASTSPRGFAMARHTMEAALGKHTLLSSTHPVVEHLEALTGEGATVTASDLIVNRGGRDAAQLPERLQRSISNGLPLSIDNRMWFTPVRNQGLCGCCWAFSTSALAEAFINRRANRTWVEDTEHWLSPQSLVDCVDVAPTPTDPMAPKGCFGGNPLDAIDVVTQQGIATETSYPFLGGTGGTCDLNTSEVVFPFSGGSLIERNSTAMMAAIHEYGGVLSAINDNLAFNYWSGHGVFDAPCEPGFGHIITLVGYGTDEESGLDYWLVKNSYGAGWGDAGYVRMRRGVNLCGVENYAFAAMPNEQ